MFNNWSNYTLKRQLLTITTILTILSLGFIIISCIVFVTIINSNSSTTLGNNFLSYTSDNIGNILQGGSRYLNTKINKLNANFINGMQVFAEDSFRSDYPFSFIKNNITSENYYNLNVLNDQDSMTFVNRTSTLEYVLPVEFSNNNDFESISIIRPNKFIRTYPNTASYSSGWNPLTATNKIVYSSMHYNNIMNKFIVAVTKNIFEPYFDSNIGVVSGDLSVLIFESSIKNMKYQQSRSTLFETDTGNIVADTENPLTTIVQYQQMTSPQITAQLWNQMLNEPNTIIENQGYYFISNYLDIKNISANKYLIISSIEKSIVLNVFSQIIQSINNISKTQILTVIIVSCVSFILTVGLSFYFTWKISTPLQELSNASFKISKQIGEENMANNVEFNVGTTGISEIDNVVRIFKATITNMNNTGNTEQLYENPYYNSNNWNSIFGSSEYTNYQPSAPPLSTVQNLFVAPDYDVSGHGIQNSFVGVNPIYEKSLAGTTITVKSSTNPTNK